MLWVLKRIVSQHRVWMSNKVLEHEKCPLFRALVQVYHFPHILNHFDTLWQWIVSFFLSINNISYIYFLLPICCTISYVGKGKYVVFWLGGHDQGLNRNHIMLCVLKKNCNKRFHCQTLWNFNYLIISRFLIICPRLCSGWASASGGPGQFLVLNNIFNYTHI